MRLYPAQEKKKKTNVLIAHAKNVLFHLQYNLQHVYILLKSFSNVSKQAVPYCTSELMMIINSISLTNEHVLRVEMFII